MCGALRLPILAAQRGPNNMTLSRLLAGFVLAASALTAQAQNYSFNCITNNSAADCSIGESQFRLAVTDLGSMVDFRFTNSGPAASSITDIYFDWASSAFSVSNGVLTDSGAGVAFEWGASPGNLPGGSSIGFYADRATDSNSPAQPNGINPGEWLNIRFTTNNDLISGLSGGGLRVGIHTQGYAGGGSESLVTTPIPEPETYAMLLAGLGLLGFEARRRKKLERAAA
jgi:hypothetical protein